MGDDLLTDSQGVEMIYSHSSVYFHEYLHVPVQYFHLHLRSFLICTGQHVILQLEGQQG